MPKVYRLLFLKLLALIAIGLPSLSAAADQPQRIALVIANGGYRNFDRLTGTSGDGDKIAKALSGVGFVDASGEGPVLAHRDLDRAGMLVAVDAFKAKLAAAGPKAFGVLYYSGHGAALGSFGDVMMLPVDASKDLAPDAAQLSRAVLTKTLLGSGAKTVLIVLDMCRNVLSEPPALAAALAAALPPPPPAAGESASTAPTGVGSKGLARIVRGSTSTMRADQGYLVAFSTSPDEVAFDDGTFSKVLAEEIKRPQQNIADALKRVSDRVAMKPGKSFQKPTFDYGLQGAPPCFVSCDVSAGGRFYDCANCPYMRAVPAGSGPFGSPPGEARRAHDEPAQTDIRIAKPFALGVYEVTVAEWAACVRDKACRPASANWAKENPNPLLPATGLSYEDAQAFVAWLSVQSGLGYRIPTDQEWEYADRAGAASAFPWGDDITPAQANYDQTASYKGSPTAPYRGYPEAVNAYPPNAFGLYQMQGNAWEWTTGCGDPGCGTHFLRGGSFEATPAELRAASRLPVSGSKRRDDAGLRVARDLNADEAGG